VSNRVSDQHCLQAWRKHRKMTQDGLAEMLGDGMTKGVISRYETGDREPSFAIMRKLCAALEITPSQFFAPPGAASIDALMQDLSPETRRRLALVVKAALALTKP
jgi:transcriptional regulator with XRE-family HTH domain